MSAHDACEIVPRGVKLGALRVKLGALPAGCEQKHTRDWPDGGLASQSKLEIGRAADETAHHAPDAPLGANDGTLVFEP